MQRILIDLRLAWRNVVRQRRRSAFALAAIAFGVIALILATGFIDWNFLHYREEMINTQLGHVRIHRAGYTESGLSDPFAYLLPENSPEFAAIAKLPGVVAVTPRLELSGLISHGDATLPFVAEGVSPPSKGSSSSVVMTAGEPLALGDPAGIVIGRGLAANLGVLKGDPVTLVINTPSGGINAMDARIRGMFSTLSKTYDDVALQMPIEAAQKLLHVKGSHTWVVSLDDTDRTQATVRDLPRILGGARYEIVPWWKLSDFYNKSADLFAKQVQMMKLIIGSLIVLSISNTLMMGVIERTGEIGTSMALGASRRFILRQFIAEALVLGGIGAAIGIVGGYGLAAIVSAVGIPVPPPPGMGHGYIGRVLVTPGLAAGAASLAMVTTLIAALYPAWKASRLVIVDALRHNRA